MSATYLYCLVQAPKAPRVASLPHGLPGTGRPRALDAGAGLWLIAADAPLEQYGEGPIERGLQDLSWVSSCAVPHEAVIERASRSGTVLPMKLFTLFRSDERALEHVAKQRKRIERLLKKLAGREEWGVRLTLDEVAALARARADAAREAGGSPGASFLLRKKKEQDATHEIVVRARERADELYEELTAAADEARRRSPPPGPAGKRVLLEGAFLIERGKVKRFQALARALAKELEGYELMLTGPWPPYNFLAEPG